MRYRREIDGLRAVAVLPVLLFHASVRGFTGGFVGVDIFFVISGYLITSNIVADLDSDQFSLQRFYDRRLRRILPSLYAVMLVSTIAAWFFMLPDPLENFGQSLFATTLFANNILLALTTGYWDISAELKPLVHTWSLAVEEQFYLIFPLILMTFWRKNSTAVIAICALIAVASLVTAQWGASAAPDRNFYMFYSRAWELIAGALCAFVLRQKSPARSESGAALGLGLILLSLFTFAPSTPMPSAYGLAPVAGTMLIILYGTKDSAVGRLLSIRPLVSIGLISYSAYLWHQPLFAFTRIILRSVPSPMLLAGLIPVALAVAYLSWRYIETPFRNPEKVKKPLLYGLMGALSLVFVVAGLSLHKLHGVPQRIFASSTANDAELLIAYNDRVFSYKKLAFTAGKPNRVLIIGNSFARDITNMLVETVDQREIEIVYRDDAPECYAKASRSFRSLLDQSTVILTNQADSEQSLCILDNISWANAKRKPIFYFGTKRFGDNINWLTQVPDGRRSFLSNELPSKYADMDRSIERRVPAPNYVGLMKHLMAHNRVIFTNGAGELLTADTMHLTKPGAIYLGTRVFRDSRLWRALHLAKSPPAAPATDVIKSQAVFISTAVPNVLSTSSRETTRWLMRATTNARSAAPHRSIGSG